VYSSIVTPKARYEAVTTTEKAAEVSYTKCIAATAGTEEQKEHLWSGDTVRNEQSIGSGRSTVIGGRE
jgi:hypothetical protein